MLGWKTIQEASNDLHVSEGHVYRMVREGRIDAKKKGRSTLVDVGSVVLLRVTTDNKPIYQK